jgi:hypothetical protein
MDQLEIASSRLIKESMRYRKEDNCKLTYILSDRIEEDIAIFYLTPIVHINNHVTCSAIILW